jgi:predicted secreted Zn-dependent protease
MTGTTDPMLALLEEAEWTAPQGRPSKESPYLAVIAKAHADQKAYAIPVTLNGKTAEDQDKDLQKHVLQMRRAGSQIDGTPSVLVQAGEVNRKTGEVRITFKTRPKITRKRNPDAAATAPEAANTNG